MAPITLQSMAEAARQRFPRLAYKDGGDRAEAALEIIEHGQIEHLGLVYMSDEKGIDYWKIGEYVCSVKGRSCNCRDYQAPTHDNGRLCKHRLAAMFLTKLEWAAKDRLLALFVNAPDAKITLRVEVIYLDKGRTFSLAGHHYPGHKWEYYNADQVYPFNEGMFNAALRVCGWGMAQRPIRNQGRYYNYFLEKGIESESSMFATAANDIERAAQNKRLEEAKNIIELQKELGYE